MIIKFKDDSVISTAYTHLFSHSVTYVFDYFKQDRAMKFYTPEMLEITKGSLASKGINENEHYDVLSYETFYA